MFVKGFLLYIGIAIVCALTAFTGNLIVGVVLGALLYAAYVIMMYGEGCSVGEHDATITSTIEKLESENKKVDPAMRKKAFSKKKGLIACACLALPLLIAAVVNVITAPTDTTAETVFGTVTRLLYLPAAFITRLCTESVKIDITGTADAAVAALSAFDYGTVDAETLVNATAKLGSYAKVIDLSSLKLMRLLYIPAGILPGLAMLAGYLRGPALRQKTVADMLKGSRKMQRRMRRNRGRAARQMKPEV